MPPYLRPTHSAPAAALPEQSAPRPVRSAARIEALDVLRGVAICGILLMNIFSMGGIREYPLTTFPARWNAEWISWGVQTFVVQGAMRGLFTMMFGASMLLMLRASHGPDGRAAPIDVWARRSLALMAFGTAQWALFLWPGEILWNYGLAGLFLLAFRSARSRTMLIAAAVLIGGLSLNIAYRSYQQVDQLHQSYPAVAARAAGQTLSSDQQAAVAAEKAQLAMLHPTPAKAAEAIEQRTHLKSLLKWSENYWAGENLGLTGWLDLAESVSFMLIGMAMFRAGVLTGDASGATYRWLMVAGYGGGLALRGLLVALAARTGWDMGSPAVGTLSWTIALAAFQPARLLVTFGHIGLVMTLWRAGLFGRAVTLRALGRMTLTVYCLQSILASLFFYGFGYVGAFGLPALWGIAAVIWVLTALFCRVWLARFEMGPGERLLRSLAYGDFRWLTRHRAGAMLAAPAL